MGSSVVRVADEEAMSSEKDSDSLPGAFEISILKVSSATFVSLSRAPDAFLLDVPTVTLYPGHSLLVFVHWLHLGFVSSH